MEEKQINKNENEIEFVHLETVMKRYIELQKRLHNFTCLLWLAWTREALFMSGSILMAPAASVPASKDRNIFWYARSMPELWSKKRSQLLSSGSLNTFPCNQIIWLPQQIHVQQQRNCWRRCSLLDSCSDFITRAKWCFKRVAAHVKQGSAHHRKIFTVHTSRLLAHGF